VEQKPDTLKNHWSAGVNKLGKSILYLILKPSCLWLVSPNF